MPWPLAGFRCIASSLTAILFAGILLIAPVEPAMAQESPSNDQCETEYRQAQESYLAAEFDPAIRLLQTCLDEAQTTLSDTTLVKMYRLLAFSYLGEGDEAGARRAVNDLLTTAPDYRPNPTQDRPDFVQLVQNAREERQQIARDSDDGRNWVKWVAGGVGVVVLGVLAAVLSGGGGDDGDD
ncbi:hypothetical protein [Longibacter sp.]|uniref:hypothetical protein n=1 Tax=Longibacter sp. TaxID=2045415 RepID=UPI003EBE3B38